MTKEEKENYRLANVFYNSESWHKFTLTTQIEVVQMLIKENTELSYGKKGMTRKLRVRRKELVEHLAKLLKKEIEHG